MKNKSSTLKKKEENIFFLPPLGLLFVNSYNTPKVTPTYFVPRIIVLIFQRDQLTTKKKLLHGNHCIYRWPQDNNHKPITSNNTK